MSRPDQVIAISQKSCSVLNNLGPKIQWVHSYVTQDKIYCVYIAPNEEMVKEHARQGGFPANRISEVKTDDRSDLGRSLNAYSPRPPSTARIWPVMNCGAVAKNRTASAISSPAAVAPHGRLLWPSAA